MVESFWKIPDTASVASVRTPLSLIKEQASALAKQTGGLLRANTITFVVGSKLYIHLEVEVPALNGYSVQLLTYAQPAQIYPGTLQFSIKGQDVEIRNEQQFVDTLRDVLSSDDVQRVIGSLMAQAQSVRAGQ
jgi:hypothetical protein